MAELISDDFLNEERYARSYSRGKFRMNGWGRTKIRIELKRRRISEYCMRKGMEEIDDEEYYQKLTKIIGDRTKGKQALPYKEKSKIFQYCYRRGYESELISAIFKELKV